MSKAPGPAVPFAQCPHGIMSDVRLSTTDRVVVLALLYWACDAAVCVVSDWRIADYVGVSIETVQRSLRALAAAGYIRCDRRPTTSENMTGRAIVLCWKADTSRVPAPPSRKGPKGNTRGSVTGEGPSRVTTRVRHGRLSGSVTHDYQGQSPVTDKREGEQQKPKTTTTSEPSSSSGGVVDGGGEGKPSADPEAMARAIKAAVKVFGEEIRERAEGACGRFDPAWVERSLELASAKADREPVGWPWVLKVLNNWRREKGPSPRAKSRRQLFSEGLRDMAAAAEKDSPLDYHVAPRGRPLSAPAPPRLITREELDAFPPPPPNARPARSLLAKAAGAEGLTGALGEIACRLGVDKKPTDEGGRG